MADRRHAVDAVTVVIKECITLSSAMRKYTKYTSQSGVVALLSGSSEIFSNQDESLADRFTNLTASRNNDPLLSGLIQLRLMLNNVKRLDDTDLLTVFQPFLLIVSTGSVSGYITSMALESLRKFLTFGIISKSSPNYVAAYRETVNSLTHCRFEGSEQTSDDSVLLKVLVLLEKLINSEHSIFLSDSIMYEVLQTVMSLACNKKRTEVLRGGAELTMMSITAIIFQRLRCLEVSESQKYINDEDISNKTLKDDMMGAGNAGHGNSPEPNNDNEVPETPLNEKQTTIVNEPEENYGISVVKDYCLLLVNVLMPQNQFKHNNSTKVFALNLLNLAVEIAGDEFSSHPRLFNLISDPVFKNVLFIIQNTDKLSLLQSALQLFTTITIILGEHLEKQVELTLQTVFDVLLNNQRENVKKRSAGVKELLIEQISILWTRSPSFFIKTFMAYDCDLNRTDLSITTLRSLVKLALPESAVTSAESVPPTCLEGLISLLDSMYDRVKEAKAPIWQKGDLHPLLKERAHKKEFIRCAEEFNRKPKKGIPLLIENKFISSNDEKHIAEFLFEKNGRLNKKTIGEYIAHPERLSLLREFVELFDFKGLRIDEALRVLLTKFRLPGESQQIERIVEVFSASYVADQEYDPEKANQDVENDYSTVQPDPDSVFILSFSVIMLNTDIHNPQVKKHMTFDDYIYNLKGCNNQRDFPLWYLDKVYCSIRDKEIVMPEEHHGNERWFDDAWNNLVSSSTVMTQKGGTSHFPPNFELKDSIQFDSAIFESVGRDIAQTLLKIFKVATDDHITTRILSTIDKCASIAAFLQQNDIFEYVINEVIKLTTLDDQLDSQNHFDYEDHDTPVVQITFEETQEVLTVSNVSARLGRSFKGQLCTVVLFRFLQKNENPKLITANLWKIILQVLLNLFENALILPDVFPDLQNRLKIGNLPRPTPEYEINKSRVNKGLLSTFASYLKGDEEPSEEEFNATATSYECIRTCRVPSSIFGNEYNVNAALVSSLLDSIQVEKTDENGRYFEAEILFLCELAVASFLFCKDQEKIGQLVLKKLFDLTFLDGASKVFVRRLLAYKALLISILQEKECLIRLVNEEVLVLNEVYDQTYWSSDQGREFIQMLLSLTDIEAYADVLLQNEGFWKLLQVYAADRKRAFVIFQYVESLVSAKPDKINGQNFMWLLNLLDEISSIGAIGGQWEQKYDRLVKTGHKVDQENPYQETIDLSLKAIKLTTRLFELQTQGSIKKAETIALVQALTHQCLNPCDQLKSFALISLESTLVKNIDKSSSDLTLEDLIENGMVTIMNDDNKESKNSETVKRILELLSNVYLSYLKSGKASNEDFLKVLEVFNKHVDDAGVEKRLQEMITEKKRSKSRTHRLQLLKVSEVSKNSLPVSF
ncbi:LAMI_0H06854g1_1 [Lachancea mirantina]|uniref:LAMI_0H06854g1_1 n=1 Tax=Lachancea mirantina TaxID=1230905 RepID=A0A1G4KFK6_9SACH|nr:LAMI_0H06854g1_1 [Lachancea mirantina]